ncbi:MAG: arsenate reductase (azurin) small subunit [Planctomycetaceae bacterium]|nr:arsenate reductase (azurin) small subunit [Planctomycetaceae bacterium]
MKAPKPCDSQACGSQPVNRRDFLSRTTATTVLLAHVFPGRVLGQDERTPVNLSTFERRRIGSVSALKDGQAVAFSYPDDGELSGCLLVKTGETSGGGEGPGQDIVAFSSRCTHMGGSLEGDYKPEHRVAGPCSLHLTTFDLTRHGMVVAGHATQALPQIVLELDGDDIYAIGVVGLLYGRATNASP